MIKSIRDKNRIVVELKSGLMVLLKGNVEVKDIKIGLNAKLLIIDNTYTELHIRIQKCKSGVQIMRTLIFDKYVVLLTKEDAVLELI